ncbi:hypothetical protein ACTMTJ_08960 [Phytohabitans sp. LJ34]|uniref:hypothetical protein n=1 Tax=Phytohabitans sp. LJ34 TaxID=3452217 RepID=UPI003F8B6FFD
MTPARVRRRQSVGHTHVHAHRGDPSLTNPGNPGTRKRLVEHQRRLRRIRAMNFRFVLPLVTAVLSMGVVSPVYAGLPASYHIVSSRADSTGASWVLTADPATATVTVAPAASSSSSLQRWHRRQLPAGHPFGGWQFANVATGLCLADPMDEWPQRLRLLDCTSAGYFTGWTGPAPRDPVPSRLTSTLTGLVAMSAAATPPAVVSVVLAPPQDAAAAGANAMWRLIPAP